MGNVEKRTSTYEHSADGAAASAVFRSAPVIRYTARRAEEVERKFHRVIAVQDTFINLESAL